MRFVLMTEPQQGMSYLDQLAIARRAEANGFEAFFRSDHFQSFPGPSGQPTTDAWAVLAGLARETERIGLGALVSPVTFRHPGVFAKVVTTVDEMSGGRIEAGVGAGWNDEEHRQLGLDFPDVGERFDLVEDELAILHGLWGEPDGWSYRGRRVSVDDTQFYPKPVQVAGRPSTPIGSVRPRIVIGGDGKPRSVRLAARYADEYNIVSARPEEVTRVSAALDEACRAIDRDPREITRSAMSGVLIGRNQDEVRERQAALMAAFGEKGAEEGEAWLEERRTRWIFGTPDEARAAVAPLCRGRRRADHAPGLPAMGPRHGRRHGRGAGRAGLGLGCLGRGTVARVVAADRVGVCAPGAGKALGDELERRGRTDERRDRGRQARHVRDQEPSGRRQVVRQLGVERLGEDRRRRDVERFRCPQQVRRPAWRARCAARAR